MMVFWLHQFSNGLRERNLADPNHFFKRATCTVTPGIHASDQEFSQTWPLQWIFISHRPFWLLLKNNSTCKHELKDLEDKLYWKNRLDWSANGHPLLQSNSRLRPFQSNGVHQSGWFPSMRDTVSAQYDAKIIHTKLITESPLLLWSFQNQRFEHFLLSCESIPACRIFIFVVRLPIFLFIENFAQTALTQHNVSYRQCN